MTVLLNATNFPPVAKDDAYNTDEDQTLNVNVASGVLKNDTDVENDPLTAVKDTDSAHGTLTLNSEGSFSYTPNAGFSGTDSFTYKASDGTNESTEATVQISVNPIGSIQPPPSAKHCKKHKGKHKGGHKAKKKGCKK